MSKIIDTEYYSERARGERRRAEAATHPRVIAAHVELASLYDALASDPNFDLPTVELPRPQRTIRGSLLDSAKRRRRRG